MNQQFDLDTWEEFESHLARLAQSLHAAKTFGSASELLYRGQSSFGWRLETTLERERTKIDTISEYFRFLSGAKPQLETFTGKKWPDIDLRAIQETYEKYDSLFLAQFPAYELCVYARHLGFPSFLLDWTRSPYIAAFFAFKNPTADRVAIWIYQEYIGQGKSGSSNEPQLKGLGPYVTSHPRHFLQQGEYTLAAQYNDGKWYIAGHHQVFELGRENQDRLLKFTLPRDERDKVLKKLDQFNINSYSLMQSEDALLETIAFRLLPRYK